jgi:hypothetical protein
MKPGDLVRHTWSSLGYGLIIEWWNSNQTVAVVHWGHTISPCALRKLERIDETK